MDPSLRRGDARGQFAPPPAHPPTSNLLPLTSSKPCNPAKTYYNTGMKLEPTTLLWAGAPQLLGFLGLLWFFSFIIKIVEKNLGLSK